MVHNLAVDKEFNTPTAETMQQLYEELLSSIPKDYHRCLKFKKDQGIIRFKSVETREWMIAHMDDLYKLKSHHFKITEDHEVVITFRDEDDSYTSIRVDRNHITLKMIIDKSRISSEYIESFKIMLGGVQAE